MSTERRKQRIRFLEVGGQADHVAAFRRWKLARRATDGRDQLALDREYAGQFAAETLRAADDDRVLPCHGCIASPKPRLRPHYLYPRTRIGCKPSQAARPAGSAI